MFKLKKLQYIIIPLVIIAVLLITSPYLVSNPGFSYGLEPEYEVLSLSLVADNNKVIDLDIESEKLVFFGASGKVDGGGDVKILLRDSTGAEYTVYENGAKSDLIAITGYSSTNTGQGYFSNACDDTCVLDEVRGPFQLVVSVDQGSTLKIARIAYR